MFGQMLVYPRGARPSGRGSYKKIGLQEYWAKRGFTGEGGNRLGILVIQDKISAGLTHRRLVNHRRFGTRQPRSQKVSEQPQSFH